jgi:predicted nuclease of restriction endonuclease-like RecB superfamily
LQRALPIRAPKTKLRIAMLVLDALCLAKPRAAVPPKEVRSALFRAAASGGAPRLALLRSVAESFAVTVVELESALFADLQGERCIAELPPSLSPSRLTTNANLAIVSSLFRRAVQLRIVVHGNCRALIRHARITGLICRESRLARAADGVVLDVSGPFALFRHSDLYGRALASLLPLIASCVELELSASCALGRDGQLCTLALRTGDPIERSPELPRPARPIEQKFERAFQRAAPGWSLVREPLAIASGERLLFPDFELVPKHDPTRSWLLEIIGFWTPEYLHDKLRILSNAGIERFVLCVDQNRLCADAELPADPRIIRHKTRIDVRAVLALIGARVDGHAPRRASSRPSASR